MTTSRPLHRLRISPAPLTGAQSRSLIDRYLGTSFGTERISYTGIPNEQRWADIRLQLIDTSDDTDRIIGQDRAAIWHVLWMRDEAAAAVTIASSDQNDTWPIAPGDSVYVPSSASFTATGGQLALLVSTSAVRSQEPVTGSPTHGTDRFFGHNRHTESLVAGGLRISRWKLTQPLAFADHYQSSCIIVALARNATVRTASTIDQVNQGQAALIDPATSPIVTPDGLAYLLTIEIAERLD